MKPTRKYLLVDRDVLPEIFQKVVEAKMLLAKGIVQNSSQAARQTGISRSAFYKYKDHIYSYNANEPSAIATLSVKLNDEPGVLSSVLGKLSSLGANILTINQNIPVDAVAPVSISLRTENLRCEIDEMMAEIRSLPGIIEVKILSAQ